MISREWKGNNADGMYSVRSGGRLASFHFNTKGVLVTIRDRNLGVIR